MRHGSRIWRRRYYDVFSHFYDRFIALHARKDESGTRAFLVKQAGLEGVKGPRVLDVCCGTGAVLSAFSELDAGGIFIGCDFSHGMLVAARQKYPAGQVKFVQGNAARLPFEDNAFHAVGCSHALYELKGQDRPMALNEMKRVVREDGVVLIMEHEVPAHPLIRMMFRLRLLTMGAADAREFVASGLKPFQQVFPSVTLSHTPSGKSKLICCRKV
mgnify:FL=1